MAIKESDLFKGVSQRTLTKIGKNADEETYRRNSIIFRQGKPALNFYVLVEGEVEIFFGKGDGPRLIISRPGEVFGWSALVEPYLYTANARCKRDTKVIAISRDLVESAIKDHPAEALAILENLIGIVAQRLRYAYRSLVPEA